MSHVQPTVPSVHLSAWSAKSLDWFSLSTAGSATASGSPFGAMLASLSQGNGTSNSPAPFAPANPFTAIGTLVANGTPLTTIADRIAQRIATSLEARFGSTISQTGLDQLRSSILKWLSNKLGPPGKSPPRRRYGQQNEISGNLLDATSAKDIPAQTIAKDTSNETGVSSAVASISSSLLAALAQSASPAHTCVHGSPSDPRVSSSPLPSSPVTPAVLIQHIAAPASGGTMVPREPQPAAASADAPAMAPPTALSMENAPDVLARMLVRAMGVDARISGNAAVSAATQQGPSQTPSAIAARLESAIASLGTSATASAVSPAGASSNGRGGQSLEGELSSEPSFSTHDAAAPSSSTIAGAPTSFFTQVQSIAHQPVASAVPVDTTAVIEQMMKSLTMRTNDQGSSEIRLHLQPENLGDVTMKITVSGSQISANVVASNADVRSALISNHHQLARSLADAGLRLSGFSVDVSGGDAGRDHQRDRTSGFGRRYVVHELQTTSSDTPALSSLAAPILGGSSLELFNYLV